MILWREWPPPAYSWEGMAWQVASHLAGLALAAMLGEINVRHINFGAQFRFQVTYDHATQLDVATFGAGPGTHILIAERIPRHTVKNRAGRADFLVSIHSITAAMGAQPIMKPCVITFKLRSLLDSLETPVGASLRPRNSLLTTGLLIPQSAKESWAAGRHRPACRHGVFRNPSSHPRTHGRSPWGIRRRHSP